MGLLVERGGGEGCGSALLCFVVFADHLLPPSLSQVSTLDSHDRRDLSVGGSSHPRYASKSPSPPNPLVRPVWAKSLNHNILSAVRFSSLPLVLNVSWSDILRSTHTSVGRSHGLVWKRDPKANARQVGEYEGVIAQSRLINVTRSTFLGGADSIASGMRAVLRHSRSVRGMGAGVPSSLVGRYVLTMRTRKYRTVV